MEQIITEILNQKFSEEEYSALFLVDLKCSKKKFEVFIDSDDRLTLGMCQRISRHVENQLDESAKVAEDYTIEVSSPGIKRPLKFKRQYPKHVGRNLEIKTVDDDRIKGKLLSVEENGITLEISRTEKQGKKKIKVIESKEIMFDQMATTIVKASI